MTWTTTAAAKDFGVSRETVIRGLRGLGLEPKQNAKFSTRDIHRALAGDLKAERVRETRARADLLELEKAKQLGDIIPKEIVKERLAAVLSPIAEVIDAAEIELPPLTNPSDTEFARRGIVEWQARIRPLIRKAAMDGI